MTNIREDIRRVKINLMLLLVVCACLISIAPNMTMAAEAIEDSSAEDSVAGTVSSVNFDKPFNEYSWVTAHNAYENDMQAQLDRGVRGFMLDLYPTDGAADEIRMCHAPSDKKCGRGDKKFVDVMNNVFIPYLKKNPNEIITILLEVYVAPELIANAFKQIPDIENLAFDPWLYRTKEGWPTLREIIDSGRRAFFFTDNSSTEGGYELNGGRVLLMRDRTAQVQNTYDLGLDPTQHQWQCESRWEDHMSEPVPAVPCTVEEQPKGCPENGTPCVIERQPAGCPKDAIPSRPIGGTPLEPSLVTGYLRNAPRLFVMNQYHGFVKSEADAGNRDNNLTYLERRVEKYCKATAGAVMQPNYIAIDYNQVGDAFAYAKALTNGGYYFYEQNNANREGDSTCVLPAGQDYNIGLASHGCENDEARSLELRGIGKGTRITLYDSPSGNKEDDFAIIDVKRDIGINENVVVGSFQVTQQTSDYAIRYFRNNGADGKISRIQIEEHPKQFSDASVVLHEGNNGSQNIVCTVGLVNPATFNLSGSCDNDETRSATIVTAKAGTVITFYGDKGSSSCGQGCSTFEVKRNITWPKTINSYDKNYEDNDIKVVRSGGTQQLDGKISSVRVAFKPDTTAPSAPVLLPQPLTLGDTSATIGWTEATDNTGVTGYGVSVNGAAQTIVTGTRYILSGLRAGTSNTVTVRARDAANNQSQPVTLVFDTRPGAPQNVSFSYANGYGKLVWKLQDLSTRYEVLVNGVKVFDGGGAIAGFHILSVPPGPEYKISIRAKKGTSYSDYVQLVETIDTSLPAMPGTPVVSGITETSATINWPPAENQSQHSYRVALNGLPLGNVSGTSYVLKSLRSGSPYLFTVRTIGANGNFSNPIGVAFKALGDPPSPPPGVPKNLQVISKTSDSVTLGWDFGEPGAMVHGVTSNHEDVGKVILLAKQATMEGLTDGLTYNFKVTAYDSYEQPSQPAEITVTIVDTLPPSSPLLNSVPIQESDTSAKIQWAPSSDNVGVTDYLVKVGNTAAVPVSGTSHLLTGLTIGTDYTVEVSARDAAGNVSPASVLTFTMKDTAAPTRPGTPVISNITSTSATVAWAASTDNVGVTGYRVSIAGMAPITVTGTSHEFSELKQMTKYSVAVQALDAAGNLSEAASADFETLFEGPQNVQFSHVGGVGRLTWLSVSDSEIDYQIFVNDKDVSDGHGAFAHTFRLSDVPPGPVYRIKIRAKKGSSYSEFLEIEELVDESSRPGNPGIPTASEVTEKTAVMTWTPSSSSQPLKGYRVSLNGLLLGTTTETTYKLNSLFSGVYYLFTVRAEDTSGNLSDGMVGGFKSLGESPLPPPGKPKNLSISNLTSNSVTLSWEKGDEGAPLYYLTTNDKYDITAKSVAPSVTIPNLVPGFEYDFKVQGVGIYQGTSEPAEIEVSVPEASR